MVERTLSASASAEYKKILEVLKKNAAMITDEWDHEISKASYLKGAELNVPEELRIERLKVLYNAMLERTEDPSSKKAVELLKSAIRAEHARNLSLSGMVKKQTMLRDTMLYVVEHDLPDISKTTAKLALDAIVDRSIESIVTIMEEFGELRASLARSLPGGDESISLDQSLARFCRSAMDYFDADLTALFRYSPDTQELVCQACSAKGLALTKDQSVMLDSFPLAAQAITQKKTIYVGDMNGENPKKKKVLGRLSFAHTICIPLLRGDKVAGIFLIGDTTKLTQFTPDEVSLAEDISKQVARVIENNELFKSLNIRTRAQKVLIDTAASLQQEIESEEIYRIVATRFTFPLPGRLWVVRARLAW